MNKRQMDIMCERVEPIDTRLKACGTVGKQGGKRRKQILKRPSMQLKNFEYKQYEGDKRAWTVEPASFGPINLLVGRNASGKTRILNVMVGLARLLAGKQQAPFGTGDFKTTLVTPNGKSFVYEVSMQKNLVTREYLSCGGDQYLIREGSGPGKIKTAPKGKMVDFQVKPNQLAIFSKRDSLQYPFLEEIAAWAEGAEHYEFAALFGPNAIGSPGMIVSESQVKDPEKILSRDFAHREILQLLVAAAIDRYGDAFKKSIFADMNKVGYELDDMGIGVLSEISMSPPPIGIWVKERDLQCNTEQNQMSLGMFRALSAVIRMNLPQFTNAPSAVFLDDVGEGLDFERSVGLIKILIEKAEKGGFQLFMTSNDRFVMNEVPLKYWSVIVRMGSLVKVKNYENSRDEFNKFEKLGLNNFDYFVANSSRT
jgi:energy-coupling factor transporter ATP-binding protein EcfA2